jgi:putative serine protease PepD
VPAAPVPVRGRTPWLALVGTATAAAVAASLTTAGLTGAFGPDEPDAGTPAPQEQAEEESTNVPVAGSSSALPDWEAVASTVRPSVVAIDVRTGAGAGTGSGVVIDREGHVLTNDHVVGDAVDGGLRVTLADGRVLEAEIVGLDPTTDLAVIRLLDAPDDLAPAQVGSSEDVEVGEAVMAVGNPLGLDSTATTGIVSAVDRPVSTSDGRATVVTNAIQIDAAINPGNSGGPLFDATGAVIGITSSIATDGSSNGSIGLGFAIPSNLASRIAEELVADGTAEHAFLGVGLSDGSAEAEGVARRGAKVEEVTEDSPAGEAGLRVDDVITAIDGDPVSGAESLTAHVREHGAAETAVLTVARDGELTEVTVTFAAREEIQDEPGQDEQGQDEQGQGEQGQGEQGRPDRAPGGGFPWGDFFDRG